MCIAPQREYFVIFGLISIFSFQFQLSQMCIAPQRGYFVIFGLIFIFSLVILVLCTLILIHDFNTVYIDCPCL